MQIFWRTLLALMLAVQVTALPIHAFAEEIVHSEAQSSAATQHSHQHDNSADESGSLDEDEVAQLHDHSCVNHCHAPVALLGSILRTTQDIKMHLTSHIAHRHSLRIIEPIERPQWLAARDKRAADIAS